MMTGEVRAKLEATFPKDHILYDEPLKKHTTFQVGGNSDCLIFVEKESELVEIINYMTKMSLPYFVLGNGSNILVGDKGYRGVVLETRHLMNTITIEETLVKNESGQEVSGAKVVAQAGALMSKIGSEALKAELTGFEFAAGIPGTIGGGTVMNAGAYGGELKQIITNVRVITKEGEIKNIPGDEMDFSYRHSAVKEKGYIVTSVEMELIKGDAKEIKAKMDELSAARKSKQPLEYPSAGSTFKRPEGYFAGKLIDDAGLRGFSVGGAQVSEKHCGFVINKSNATAADIDQLMKQVSAKVKDAFGVELEPEVIRVGEF